MCDDLYGQPSGVGNNAAGGEVVQPHTVLEALDGILDLGVAEEVASVKKRQVRWAIILSLPAIAMWFTLLAWSHL